jgi:S1-C subfamily serine protease
LLRDYNTAMEHLTKQQIVLLTLFTSFVTSIATGIVTVALVDQAPSGVTSTINNVINRTVEEIAPGTTQSAAVSNSSVSGNTNLFTDPADQIANATSIAQKSLVRIELNGTPTGLGVIVSASGVVVSDKSIVSTVGSYYSAVLADGTQYPLEILQSQSNGDIVLLLIQVPPGSLASSTKKFTPAVFASLTSADAPRLGETVLAFTGLDAVALDEGIVKKINMTDALVGASSTISSFQTNIDGSDIIIGSPLFDASGALLGIKTLGVKSNEFYPIGYLKTLIASL